MDRYSIIKYTLVLLSVALLQPRDLDNMQRIYLEY